MPNSNQELPLSGIKVLDFGRVISGPFVGQVLSDMGADVIKIERLGSGDETRSYVSVGKPGESSLFSTLNRNKRSLAIDLGHADAKRVILKLLETTDVLLHNFRPGVMNRLGLSAEDVWKVNPRIVYCGISGFGPGRFEKRPANDVIAQAYGGLMSFTGDADGPPVRVPVPIADYTAGFYATVGILSGLVKRATTGRGCTVQTSLIEGLMALECMHIGDFLKTGVLPPKLASGNMLGQPNQAFRTKDGAAVIAAVNDAMWRRCATQLSGEELANNPRYATGPDRLTHKDELAKVVEELTMKHTTEEVVALMAKAECVCSPINNLDQLTKDPHIRELGIIQKSESEGIELVASPLMINGERPKSRRAAPSLGQDADVILKEAGFTAKDIEGFRAAKVLPAS